MTASSLEHFNFGLTLRPVAPGTLVKFVQEMVSTKPSNICSLCIKKTSSTQFTHQNIVATKRWFTLQGSVENHFFNVCKDHFVGA